MFRSPTVRDTPPPAAGRRSRWRPPLLPRLRAPGPRLPRLVRRGRPPESAARPQGTADPAPDTQSAGPDPRPAGAGSRSRTGSRVPQNADRQWCGWCGDSDGGGGIAGVAASTSAFVTASRTTSRSRSRWRGPTHFSMVVAGSWMLGTVTRYSHLCPGQRSAALREQSRRSRHSPHLLITQAVTQTHTKLGRTITRPHTHSHWLAERGEKGGTSGRRRVRTPARHTGNYGMVFYGIQFTFSPANTSET